MNTPIDIERILDLARWAPSGDNVQSHEFEILGPDHVLVHATDTRFDCVYDLDGHPSQIAFGALLETIAIGASEQGLRADITRRPTAGTDESTLLFDVRLEAVPGLPCDPRIGALRDRTVQRRPMHTRPLTQEVKAALEGSVGEYAITWLESRSDKWRAARLMFNNAKLRLTMPEAYQVHRRIIHWGVSRSDDRVPDQALGVDPMTLKLMRWAMVSWRRLSFMNAVMGTWAPRLQMDFLPSLACAAHFVLKAPRQPSTVDDYIAAGRAVQRFWLTLTRLGLYMQPEMTPLIFSKHVREGTEFTQLAKLHPLASRLQQQTAELVFAGPGFPVFMGRLGDGPAPAARSERKPLESLIRRSS
jgi:hypothetical protein